MTLRFQVSDMFDPAGQTRTEAGAFLAAIVLPAATVDGEVAVHAFFNSLSDGIIAKGRAVAEAVLTCYRCLTEWSVPFETGFEQVFRMRPDDGEDELPIETGGWIDLEPMVHDEVALGLPTRPLCKEDCRGLCPTCGTDLNTNPCDGHGDVPDSPFASLRQLFDS